MKELLRRWWSGRARFERDLAEFLEELPEGKALVVVESPARACMKAEGSLIYIRRDGMRVLIVPRGGEGFVRIGRPRADYEAL